jgi:hypothetical protein
LLLNFRGDGSNQYSIRTGGKPDDDGVLHRSRGEQTPYYEVETKLKVKNKKKQERQAGRDNRK